MTMYSALAVHLTNPANSRSRLGDIGIQKVIGVTMPTVGLLEMPSTGDLTREPTERVCGASNRFQVPRVDAPSIAAQVIDLQSIRDGASYQFVGYPMHLEGRAPCGHRIYLAVAMSVQSTHPYPTGIALPERAIEIDLPPQPLRQWDSNTAVSVCRILSESPSLCFSPIVKAAEIPSLRPTVTARHQASRIHDFLQILVPAYSSRCSP